MRGSLKPESTMSALKRTYASAWLVTASISAGTAMAASARRTVRAASMRIGKSTDPSRSIADLSCAGVTFSAAAGERAGVWAVRAGA